MLELTPAAVAAIRDFADEGGLRFVAREEDGDTHFDPSVVDGPEPGDEVVESGGARVFLDEAAAEALADQVLDVHSHGEHVHFEFLPQGGEAAPPEEL